MQHRTKIAALRRVVLVAGLCCLVLGAAAAQEYPSRTVKMIVPYPAGGITDVLPRALQDQLARKWVQPIVVENKPGVAGNLGAEAVFISDPDGHTLMVTAPSPLTVNASLYPKLPFEPSAFVPVSILATIPTGMFIANKVPANNLAEFIAYAILRPHVDSGKLKLLAITASQRASMLPDVPTVGEAGFPDVTIDGLVGILDLCISRFNAFARLQNELEKTRSQLEERKVIDRAKGILMKAKNLTEEQAYALLRKTAMNENKKIADVAQSVVTAAELFK